MVVDEHSGEEFQWFDARLKHDGETTGRAWQRRTRQFLTESEEALSPTGEETKAVALLGARQVVL